MTVWVLVDREYDSIDGVYTAEAKLRKERELAAVAVARREHNVQNLARQLDVLEQEIDGMRKAVEVILSEEAAAKEANHTGRLKEVRKERKVVLNRIKEKSYRLEKLKQVFAELASLTEQEALRKYNTGYYFEECVLEEV